MGAPEHSEGNVVNTATTNMYGGYNYTANGAMKRGTTDCRRFKKRRGGQATLTVYSKIIFFDATIGSNSYTICTMHVKYIFPTDCGQPISLCTMRNIGFYSKFYFTMNSL